MIQWSPELSVGVGIIDEQHHRFVDIINELEASANAKDRFEIEGLVLTKLLGYAQYHFATEEEFFALFDYSDAVEHIASHHELLKRLRDFFDAHHDQRKPVADELLAFLLDWLVNHLQQQDRKYTKCFNEHGLV